MSLENDLMRSGQAFGNAARQIASEPNRDSIKAAEDAVLAIVAIGDEIFKGAIEDAGVTLEAVHEALDLGFYVLNGVAQANVQAFAAEVDEYMAFFEPS